MTRPHCKRGPVLVLIPNGPVGDILGSAPGASLVLASDIAETYQVDLCAQLMLLRDLSWDSYEEQDEFPRDLIIYWAGVHRSMAFQLCSYKGFHPFPLPGPMGRETRMEHTVTKRPPLQCQDVWIKATEEHGGNRNRIMERARNGNTIIWHHQRQAKII